MDRFAIGSGPSRLVFGVEGRQAWLCEAGGIELCPGGQETGPARSRGLAVLNTTAGRTEADDWECLGVEAGAGGAEGTLRLRAAGCGLEWVSRWSVDAATGVVRRRDTLINAGAEPAVVLRCLARLAFPPGRYQVYSQQSAWCRENQGAWQPLHAGELVLRNVSGRTSNGATPYAAVRETDRRDGLVFHVVPTGNWVIRVAPVAVPDSPPYAVVELGLADHNLRLALAPGESFDLPDLLIQPLDGGEAHLAAPALHAYVHAHLPEDVKPEAPVVYNTWFDQFEILDLPRLRRQLAAARAIGCEVFAVDAGWYGQGGSNWAAQVGDWREKLAAAFHGDMPAFAREVRQAGLAFGLWMEPERVGAEAPVRAAHPEWFVPVPPHARFDLAQPAARAWLRGEIGRLVETYELGWMKLDFNFDLDDDPSGAELAGYTEAWYGLLDEVRRAYPGAFFEGCASGAMRLDLNIQRHVDGHFLSDTVDPVDMLRITQGACLRLLPGRLTRWSVLRPAEPAVPRYGQRAADSPPTVLAPGGALWEPCGAVAPDFAVLAALPGMLGFSGDLAGLPDAVRHTLAGHVAFFKRHRRFLAGAVAHLLTPPEPISAREGWVGFQFQDPGGADSLVCVYRLGAVADHGPWKLRHLDPGGRYAVEFPTGGEPLRATGRDLMERGLAIPMPATGASRVHAAALARVFPA